MAFPSVTPNTDLASVLASLGGQVQNPLAGLPPAMALDPTQPGPTALGPPPAMPPPSMPRPDGPTSDNAVVRTIRSLAPLIFAAIAAKQGGPQSSAAVLQGLSLAQERKKAEAQAQAELDAKNAVTAEAAAFKRDEFNLKKQQAIADFFAKEVQPTLAQPEAQDPAWRARALVLLDERGVAMGLPKGYVMTRAGSPNAEALAKAASAELARLQNDPRYKDADVDHFVLQTVPPALARMGVKGDAQGRLPVTHLRALAGLSLIDPETGSPVPKTVKAEQPATEFERYLGTVLQDEAAKRGKTPADLTPAERRAITLQARKEYGQADDRPTAASAEPMGDLPIKVQTRVDVVATSFRNEPVVKQVQTQAEAYDFVKNTPNNTDSSADDQALIYAFAKAMDPNSVVREGEYATVQKYAQSWASTFGFNASRVFANGPFLSPEARRNMKETIRRRYAAGRKQYDNLAAQYAKRVNQITGKTDGANRLIDYSAVFPDTSAAGVNVGGFIVKPSGGR